MCWSKNPQQILSVLDGAQRKSMLYCDLTTHTCRPCIRKPLSCVVCVDKQDRPHANSRDLHCHLWEQVFKIKQLDRPAGTTFYFKNGDTLLSYSHYCHSDTVQPPLTFPLSLICLLPALHLSTFRLFQSWSSGWRWQRTSWRSVWRTKWRLDCISKIEMRPRNGERS